MNEQKASKGLATVWAVVIAVIVTGLIVGGGVYWWQRSSAEKTEERLQKQISQLQEELRRLQKQKLKEPATEKSGTQAREDEYKGWKTYTNSKYGYTMRYPADWTVKENLYREPTLDNAQVENITFSSPDNKYFLLFGIKKKGSDILLSGRTGVGAGEFVTNGTIVIGGATVQITYLVYKGRVKEVFYPSGSPKDGFEINDFIGGAEFSYGFTPADYEQLDLGSTPESEIANKILRSFQLAR